jgi:hypothetical protein
MSGKHKTHGRQANPRQGSHPPKDSPYTTTELRDTTKEAIDDMGKIYSSFWARKPIIYDPKSVNNELEVKFSTIKKGNRSKVQPLTRNDYDNVVSKIRSLGLECICCELITKYWIVPVKWR